MSTLYPQKRKHTAEEMAKQFGVSRRTVQRIMSQPRDEYMAEAHARQEKALSLRESGLKWYEVGSKMGDISASAAYRLAAKAKTRREQSAA